MEEESKYLKRFCKECDKEFSIREDEIDFYKSIGKLEATDYCPDCRIVEHDDHHHKRDPWANPLK